MSHDTHNDAEQQRLYERATAAMRRKAFKAGVTTGYVGGITAGTLAGIVGGLALIPVAAAGGIGPLIGMSLLAGFFSGALTVIGSMFVHIANDIETPGYRESYDKHMPIAAFVAGAARSFSRTPVGWPLGIAMLTARGIKKVAGGLTWFTKKADPQGKASNLQILFGMPASKPKPVKLALPAEAKPAATPTANVSITIERPTPKHRNANDARNG